MNIFFYKQDDNSYNQQIKAKSKDDRQNCELPPELEQNVTDLRDLLLDSIANNNQEKFYTHIGDFNQIFINYPSYNLKIIEIIWHPLLGQCLLNSLHSFLNLNIDNIMRSKIVSDNLLLISKLLKHQEVKLFYSDSTLTQNTIEILSISSNYINIIEQSLHVLLKTCKFFFNPISADNPRLPFDLKDMLSCFENNYYKSELCEVYVSRFLKKIIKYLDFTKYVKKICDLYYYILVKSKSQISIKHLMISLDLLVSCDAQHFLNQILLSEILNQFKNYIRKHKEILHQSCPCFLIPFLNFVKDATDFGDYRLVFRMFKIIGINFFKRIYRNKSNPQIQYFILNIFIIHLKKLFYTNEEDKIYELTKIFELLEVILKEFEQNEFQIQLLTIHFVYTLFEIDPDNICTKLSENSKTFLGKFSYFVFNSNNDKTIYYYLRLLIFVLDYQIKNDISSILESTDKKFEQIDFINKFFKYDLNNQIIDMINNGELEGKNREYAQFLLQSVSDHMKKPKSSNS